MLREFLVSFDSAIFIVQNYAVKKEEVDAVLDEIKRANEKKQRLDPVGSLMAQAGWEAEKHGVKYLPTILEAVRLLEKDLPSEKRYLTPNRYIKLLAIGESTASTRAFWDNMITRDEQLRNAAMHAERANTLYQILLHGDALS